MFKAAFVCTEKLVAPGGASAIITLMAAPADGKAFADNFSSGKIVLTSSDAAFASQFVLGNRYLVQVSEEV